MARRRGQRGRHRDYYYRNDSYDDDDSLGIFPHIDLPSDIADVLQKYLFEEAEKAAAAKGITTEKEIAARLKEHGITGVAKKSQKLFPVGDHDWGERSRALASEYFTREKRMEIQQKLVKEGIHIGKWGKNHDGVDGVWGDDTLAGIAQAIQEGKYEKIFGPEDPTARAQREQAAREQTDREARERTAREQAAREQAAREQAAREQAAREQAAREQAAREQATREQAAREQADREARERTAREQAAREQAAREQAAREAKERTAREQATREQADREAKDRTAQEQAAREQAAREQTAREQAAREQAAREQAAREQTAREQAARDLAERQRQAKQFPTKGAEPNPLAQTHIHIGGSLWLPKDKSINMFFGKPIYEKDMDHNDPATLPKNLTPGLDELARTAAVNDWILRDRKDPINKKPLAERLEQRVRVAADAVFDDKGASFIKAIKEKAEKQEALIRERQQAGKPLSETEVKRMTQALVSEGLHTVVGVKPAPAAVAEGPEKKPRTWFESLTRAYEKQLEAIGKRLAAEKAAKERQAQEAAADAERKSQAAALAAHEAAEARKEAETKRKEAEAKSKADEAKRIAKANQDAIELKKAQAAQAAQALLMKSKVPPHQFDVLTKENFAGAPTPEALTQKLADAFYKKAEEAANAEAKKQGVASWLSYQMGSDVPITKDQAKDILLDLGVHSVDDALATRIAGKENKTNLKAITEAFAQAAKRDTETLTKGLKRDPQLFTVHLTKAWQHWITHGLPEGMPNMILPSSRIDTLMQAHLSPNGMSPAALALLQQDIDKRIGDPRVQATHVWAKKNQEVLKTLTPFSPGEKALAGLRGFGINTDKEVQDLFVKAYKADKNSPLESGLKAVFDHRNQPQQVAAVRSFAAPAAPKPPAFELPKDAITIGGVSLIPDGFDVKKLAGGLLKAVQGSLVNVKDKDAILKDEIVHKLAELDDKKHRVFLSPEARAKAAKAFKDLKFASLDEGAMATHLEAMLKGAMKTDKSVADTILANTLPPQHKQLRVFVAGHGDGDSGAVSKEPIERIPDYFKHYLVNDPKDPAPGMYRPMSLQEWENWGKAPKRNPEKGEPLLGPRKFAEHWGASIIQNIGVKLSQQTGHEAFSRAEHPFNKTIAVLNEIKPDVVDVTHMDSRGVIGQDGRKLLFAEPQVWIAKKGAWEQGCLEDAAKEKGSGPDKENADEPPRTPLDIVTNFSRGVIDNIKKLNLNPFGGRTEPTKQTARHLPTLNICKLDYQPASGSGKIPYPALMESGNVDTIADDLPAAFGTKLQDSFFYKIALAKVAQHDKMAEQGYGNPKVFAKPTVPASVLIARRSVFEDPATRIASATKPEPPPVGQRGLMAGHGRGPNSKSPGTMSGVGAPKTVPPPDPEEAKRAEEKRKADEAAKRLEEQRKADEAAKRAEEKRKAEEAAAARRKSAAAAPPPAPLPPPAAAPPPPPAPPSAPKKGAIIPIPSPPEHMAALAEAAKSDPHLASWLKLKPKLEAMRAGTIPIPATPPPEWQSGQERWTEAAKGMKGRLKAEQAGLFEEFGNRGNAPLEADSRVVALKNIPPGLLDAKKAAALFRGGVFKGGAAQIAELGEIARAEGLDPRQFVPKIANESAGGRSDISRKHLNVAGLMAGIGRDNRIAEHFKNPYEGAFNAALRLYREDKPYVYNQDENGKPLPPILTYAKLHGVYTPTGAPNDVRGTNAKAAKEILETSRELSIIPGQTRAVPPAPPPPPPPPAPKDEHAIALKRVTAAMEGVLSGSGLRTRDEAIQAFYGLLGKVPGKNPQGGGLAFHKEEADLLREAMLQDNGRGKESWQPVKGWLETPAEPAAVERPEPRVAPPARKRPEPERVPAEPKATDRKGPWQLIFKKLKKEGGLHPPSGHDYRRLAGNNVKSLTVSVVKSVTASAPAPAKSASPGKKDEGHKDTGQDTAAANHKSPATQAAKSFYKFEEPSPDLTLVG